MNENKPKEGKEVEKRQKKWQDIMESKSWFTQSKYINSTINVNRLYPPGQK